MSDSQWQEELAPVTRQLQIIVGALVAGTVSFLAIVLVMTANKAIERLQADLPIMTFVALAFAASAVLARVIAPRIIVTQGRRKILRGTWQPPQGPAASARTAAFLERTGDAGKLAMLLTTRTIVAAAILEGAAFFALVAYMLERSPLSLIVAVALILALILHIPTCSRTVHWIEEQLNLLRQEQQLS